MRSENERLRRELELERRLHQGDHEILKIVTGHPLAYRWSPTEARHWLKRRAKVLEDLRRELDEVCQASSAGILENTTKGARIQNLEEEVARLQARIRFFGHDPDCQFVYDPSDCPDDCTGCATAPSAPVGGEEENHE